MATEPNPAVTPEATASQPEVTATPPPDETADLSPEERAAYLAEKELWNGWGPRERIAAMQLAREAYQARQAKTATTPTPAETPAKSEDDPIVAANKRVEALEKRINDKEASEKQKADYEKWIGDIDGEIGAYPDVASDSTARSLIKTATKAKFFETKSVKLAVKAAVEELKQVIAKRTEEYVKAKIDDKTKAGEVSGGRTPPVTNREPGRSDLSSGETRRRVEKKLASGAY